MSIIHDALKKIQQGLPPKTDETLPVETLPGQNKIKSTLVTVCTVLITAAITIASAEYIYQQFQNNIPQVQRLAKKSFYKLIHKEELPAFKTRAPEDLKPLAQLTINPPAGTVTLNVHGIMANAAGNLALINNQVYQAGDEVDGAKIIKINLDSITVNINGTEKTINVK